MSTRTIFCRFCGAAGAHRFGKDRKHRQRYQCRLFAIRSPPIPPPRHRHFLLKIIHFSAGLALTALLIAGIVHAQTPSSHSLQFTILSSRSLSCTAGDFVTVDAPVKNTGLTPLGSITTYLSLVDTENKLPVDLEDWSAEKGRFIGTIDPGQVLPLQWKIPFVKAGNYDLSIVADIAGDAQPEISTVTHFSVLPNKNLNPG